MKYGYEVLGGLIKWSYMVIKDQRHKEINQYKKGQHDNTLNILADNSYLLSYPSVVSIRFWWDKAVMSFDTYVML